MIIRINKDIPRSVTGMMSLAMKAGAIAHGEGRAQDAIRGGRAALIILSSDASANTEKKFSDMGAFRNIPVVIMSDRYELGNIIGRRFAVVMAVCNEGFSGSIMKNLDIDE